MQNISSPYHTYFFRFITLQNFLLGFFRKMIQLPTFFSYMLGFFLWVAYRIQKLFYLYHTCFFTFVTFENFTFQIFPDNVLTSNRKTKKIILQVRFSWWGGCRIQKISTVYHTCFFRFTNLQNITSRIFSGNALSFNRNTKIFLLQVTFFFFLWGGD